MSYDPDKVFFTSDMHYGHARVIEFCNRPFKDVKEMDEAMIHRFNEVVPLDGHTFIIGDVSFHKTSETINILRRLNGTKYLVEGNHDKKRLNEEMRKMFGWTATQRQEIEVTDPDAERTGGKQFIVLDHYSMRVWNKSHFGTWQLYGHSHGSLPDDPNSLSIDVGVDAHDFYPVSYAQVKALMKRKTFKPIDHHGKREDGY